MACFDTAFHATLPPQAATYAVPRRWREEGDRVHSPSGELPATLVVRARKDLESDRRVRRLLAPTR